MKILVFGNVGSGKTTLINRLRKSVPFEVIAIDDFRRKVGDGSKKAETEARKEFFSSVKENKDQFIECIGVGMVADELFELLSEHSETIICITLYAPKEICKNRLANRVWDIPFPESAEKVPSLLERTESKIESGEITSKWNEKDNTILVYKQNIEAKDIELITSDLIELIKSERNAQELSMNDIKLMLNEDVQGYYGNEYLNYQKNAIESNDKFIADRLMVAKFISSLELTGNIIDIGSGQCQWFYLFEKTANHYFAVEANKIALSLAPKNAKLTIINQNIFDHEFNLRQTIKGQIEIAFFSFFLSHFSDNNIQALLNKLQPINSLLIVDSLWSEKHKEKYLTKKLTRIKRKTSEKGSIDLPKRFFDYSDIEKLVKPFGYTIEKFHEGNYWFACFITNDHMGSDVKATL
jgi:broad-specificity NMP kinase